MNELFALTAPNEVCGTTVLPIAANNVITTQEETYKYLLSNLAPKQKMVLQAIAREGKARNVTSAAFMRKYNLPSASSVQAAIKGLLKTTSSRKKTMPTRCTTTSFPPGWRRTISATAF